MAVVTLSHAPPEQRVYVYPTNIKIPTTKKRRLTFVLRGRPVCWCAGKLRTPRSRESNMRSDGSDHFYRNARLNLLANPGQ